MKKKQQTKLKSKQKRVVSRKKWNRGKIGRGTIFIVVIMISLMFTGFLFVGGTLPTTIPAPNTDNIVAVNKDKVYTREQGLQMHYLEGATVTPFPTLGPAAPRPESLAVTEAACTGAISGTAKPEYVWAYRIASTPASGNQQALQVFFSGADAVAGGTDVMKQKPTDHAVKPPINPANKDAGGYPISPAVFITDITANAGDTSGDAKSGGVPQFPSDIYGAWKTDKGVSSAVPNNQNLGPGADPWPPANGPGGGGRQSTWTAEIIWKVPELKTKTGGALTVGNSYRMQVVLHSGTKNDEITELCATFKLTPPQQQGGAPQPNPSQP